MNNCLGAVLLHMFEMCEYSEFEIALFNLSVSICICRLMVAIFVEFLIFRFDTNH